jgi:CHASE2 domain-containing sensor protein
MSDERKGKGVIPWKWIMSILAAIAVVLGIVLWSNHYTLRGLFIGFAVGIGCTIAACCVSELVGKRNTTEAPPPKQ